MHTLFAEWYRVAAIEPRSDDLPKRWAGVEAAVKELEKDKTIDIIRLYLGVNVQPGFKDQLATVFQKSDPAFPMRKNELELQVLAGAIVAQYLETQRTNLGDVFALAIVSGSCFGLRSRILLPDILTIAQKYLFQEGLKIRSYTSAPSIKGLVLKNDKLMTEIKASAAQNNIATVVEALGPVFQKLIENTTTVTESTSKAVNVLDTHIAGLVEQTNILWWVFAGSSRDFNLPYCQVPWPSACLIAGKELDDLTEMIPGPVAAVAVLNKILSDGKVATDVVSFEEAVSGLDETWKSKCLESTDARNDDFCPVHLALRKSVDSKAWVKPFEASTSIKLKKAKITGITLGFQMYNERLLQKAIRELS